MTLPAKKKLPVIPLERKRQIWEYIQQRGSGKIHELAQYFQVSEATVRRDLNELVGEGRVLRAHGGAMLPSPSLQAEKILQTGEKSFLLNRRIAIGRCVASIIRDGESVYLGTGPIAYQVARCLTMHRNLMVITNDLRIAFGVPFHASCSVAVTGGIKSGDMLVGPQAEMFLQGIHADKAVISGCAVDFEFGISDEDLIETAVKRKAVDQAKQVILATDHDCFGKVALVQICTMQDIDLIVTDQGLSQEHIRRIKREGLHFQLA